MDAEQKEFLDSLNLDDKPKTILKWKSPKDELPPNGKRVLILVKYGTSGKLWSAIAEYIHPKTVRAEDFFDDECEGAYEYDEEKDCDWVKSNWYECNLYEEIHWCVNDEVVWWAEIEKPEEM
jgi:hypothetical protein